MPSKMRIAPNFTPTKNSVKPTRIFSRFGMEISCGESPKNASTILLARSPTNGILPSIFDAIHPSRTRVCKYIRATPANNNSRIYLFVLIITVIPTTNTIIR
jgi:hypothetical protein